LIDCHTQARAWQITVLNVNRDADYADIPGFESR
jgi:hypothetical protein